MAVRRVLIRNTTTGNSTTVTERAAAVWLRRGWEVVTETSPKAVVLDAAGKALGHDADPAATRSQILEAVTGHDGGGEHDESDDDEPGDPAGTSRNQS